MSGTDRNSSNSFTRTGPAHFEPLLPCLSCLRAALLRVAPAPRRLSPPAPHRPTMADAASQSDFRASKDITERTQGSSYHVRCRCLTRAPALRAAAVQLRQLATAGGPGAAATACPLPPARRPSSLSYFGAGTDLCTVRSSPCLSLCPPAAPPSPIIARPLQLNVGRESINHLPYKNDQQP